MRKSSLVIVIMLSAWLLMVGCNADEGLQQESKPVVVDLALTVSNAPQLTTRMTGTNVQAAGNYRGIEMSRIVPFNTHGKITVDDTPTWYQISALRTDYLRTDHFYLYKNCMIMEGAASFLTYGRAPKGSLTKAANGSIIETFPLAMDPQHIRFSLEPISQRVVHSTATSLADYMTSIATAKGNNIAWKDAPSNVLKTMFLNFVNQTEAVTGGNVLPGSSANIKAYTQLLRTVLSGMLSGMSLSGDDAAICTAIIAKIDTYNTDWDGFPASLGLPDGAAAIRWNGTSFTPQISYTSLADINGIDRFTYPAEIYYYGNSRIVTSNIDGRQQIYDDVSNQEWYQVLTRYEYQDNAAVTHNTRSVAIKDPLQYGVARLQVKLIKTASPLKDAKGADIPVGATSFPLTSIIVGGQMPVGFDFAPTTSYPVYSETDIVYVYDNQVKTNGPSGNEYFYLSSAADATQMTNTLVLQSYDHKVVPVVLEFINNSGYDFEGLDGTVLKGTKFYLVALIDPATKSGDPLTQIRDRVFTQDYTTTLNMKVTGLSKAYNVVPNLLSPRLELGIELVSQWASTTPEEIVF